MNELQTRVPQKNHWNQAAKLLLTLLILAIPAVTTFLLPAVLTDSNFAQYHIVWNDEVQYWQEINTFKEVGFNGGYFSVEEMTAPFKFSHFGPHGPVYSLILGLLARLFGWTILSGPIYNLLFITIGISLFLFITRPNVKKKIYLLIFILFLYPVMLYIPATMQESLHQALGFIIAGILIYFSSQTKKPPISIVLALAAVIFASLIRVTWAFVLFPLIFLLFGKRNIKSLLVSTLISLSLIVFLFWLYSRWTSAFPDWFVYQLLNGGYSLKRTIYELLIHTQHNLISYFSISQGANILEILQRFQLLLLILISCIALIKKKYQFIIPLFILASEVAATIVIYDVAYFRDYRTLAPFLILGVLFGIEGLEVKTIKWLLVGYLVLNGLFIHTFLDGYQNVFHSDRFSGDYDKNPENVPIERLSALKYQENASPWCNTMLTTKIFTPDLLSLPAGFGVGIILDEHRISVPVKSHYLLIPPGLKNDLVTDGEVSVIQEIGDLILYEQTNDQCQRTVK